MNAKSNIFCPNCSAGNKIEQNFCRFCGFNLLETASSLRAQLSSGEKQRHFNKLHLIKRLTDYAEIGLTLAAVAGALFYIYGFFVRQSPPPPPSPRSPFIFTIAGFLIVYMILSYWRRKNTIGYWEELAAKKAASPGELKTRETAKLLEEKPFAPIPSVTENSTELLFAENKTRKLG